MPRSERLVARLRAGARLAPAVFGLWLFLGVFLGVQIYLGNAGSGVRLARAVEVSVQRYFVYAILTFPVIWLCRRHPLTPARWRAWVPAYTAGLAVYMVSYALLRMSIGAPVDRATLEPLPVSAGTAAALVRSNVFELFWTYSGVVIAMAAIQYHGQLHARQLAEAELQRQVAEYKLQVLKLQLRPHFLFNTLNGIATLMLRDVQTAREMLLRLSDLLRIVLSHSARSLVPLREEMAFVDAYLQLEKMRFGERLGIRLDLEPATLDALVPSMILQPLVENAIQHGIAAVLTGGTLAVTARSTDGRLRITIANDGPAHPSVSGRDTSAGIGLGNARARLAQLYGEAHELRMVDRAQGGVELSLAIPFRSSAGDREPAA